MRIHPILAGLTASLLLSGCVFAPKVADEQPYANHCEMNTKKLVLDSPKQMAAVGCHQTAHGAEFISCLIVAGVIVPAGSFVISGSMVLVNNTLHWMEYHGSCDKDQVEEDLTKPPQVADQNEPPEPSEPPEQRTQGTQDPNDSDTSHRQIL